MLQPALEFLDADITDIAKEVGVPIFVAIGGILRAFDFPNY